MKLAEKLRLMSTTMRTPEELVTKEIVGFFDDSFRSNEMIGPMETLSPLAKSPKTAKLF